MKMLCRLMGVSRSGFYDWLRNQDREPDPEHEEKLGWVKEVAEASDHTYGSRRMSKALQALGLLMIAYMEPFRDRHNGAT